MSKQRILPLEPADVRGKVRARSWMIYGAIAVFIVLAAAYVGGGEEPIRPIEQQISLPMSDAAPLDSGER